jgi:hypothetical protein
VVIAEAETGSFQPNRAWKAKNVQEAFRNEVFQKALQDVNSRPAEFCKSVGEGSCKPRRAMKTNSEEIV